MKNNNVRNNTRTVMRITPCAGQFARAQLDPFSASLRQMLPCIPDNLVIPSQKLSTFYRGICTIGVNGIGVLTANLSQNNQDLNQILSTTVSYVSAGNIPNTDSAGILKYKNSGYPYPSGLTEAGYSTVMPSTRTVGCGIRVRYVGTELNRGGMIFANTLNTSGNSWVGKSISLLQGAPETTVHQVDRNWKTLCYRIADPNGADYNEVARGFTLDNAPSAVTSCFGNATFIFTGSQGNQFEFECINFFEIISNEARTVPSVSASESDITGMSIVRSYASSLLASEAGQMALSGFGKFLTNSAATLLSGLTGVPQPALAMAATPLIGWR